MDQFISAHCLRTGRVRVSDFLRALQAAGIVMPRAEVIAALPHCGDFKIVRSGNQDWIDGLSLRSMVESRLKRFIDYECLRADGLSCRLATVAHGSFLSRAQTIYQLEQWGFTIATAGGAHVVRGLGIKEEHA